MSLPFCPHCRGGLTAFITGDVTCLLCKKYHSHLSNIVKEFDVSIKETSLPKPTPIWAKSKEEQALLKESMNKRSLQTIDEPCLKCNHTPVGYYLKQLRSLDEGATVFYECPKCDWHWSTNN